MWTGSAPGCRDFPPRQADVLFVVGTISHKVGAGAEAYPRPDGGAPIGWSPSESARAPAASYDNYATVVGIGTIMPVRVLEDRVLPRPSDGCAGKRAAPETRPDIF